MTPEGAGRLVAGSDLPAEVEEQPDVCIVGSGTGGAVLAARLSAMGARVVVLEEGGQLTRRDFDMREANAYSRLYQERGQRATADLAISVLQGRTWGGSTVVGWGTHFRAPERVLAHWARVHGVEGLDAAALAPHFEAVEGRLGTTEWPLSRANENNRVLWSGATLLGLSRELLRRNVRGCQALGYCGMGCPTDARQSMALTYLPDALSRGARVYLNTRALRIEHQGRRVLGVEAQVRDPTGPGARRLRVQPRLLILCGGAINGPELLLRSGLDGDGQVGRRTFLQPAVASIGIFAHRIEGWSGVPQSVASLHFADRGPERVGFVLQAVPIHPMLTATLLGGFGSRHQEVMAQLPHASALVGLAIDGLLPEEAGGRVALRRDGRVRLDYDIGPAVWEALRQASRAMARIQLAAGATAVYSVHEDPVVIRSEAEVARLDDAPWAPERVGLLSTHPVGGCSMGRDPRRSVVDSQLRHHQLENLFVVDGSVFPSSLGVSPQGTIAALAHWAAERIAKAIA